MHCPHCGFGQPSDHRFCLSCGARGAVCALSIPDEEAEAPSVFLTAAVADGEAMKSLSAPPG